MTLFRRTRLPSPAPASRQEDMPPRPQSPPPGDRPRGAMVTEGPRVTEWDPCIGAGPMAVASSKNGEQ